MTLKKILSKVFGKIRFFMYICTQINIDKLLIFTLRYYEIQGFVYVVLSDVINVILWLL
jgi:hypothetical protein